MIRSNLPKMLLSDHYTSEQKETVFLTVHERNRDIATANYGRSGSALESTRLPLKINGRALLQNTRYRPQSPIITGPSIIHWRASVRCRHPSTGMYPNIAATPAPAKTRKTRFRFGRICNSFGIRIPIQAASNPAHPPTASLTVRAIKGSVYPSGFASALGRRPKSVSDKMRPKKMKHIAGTSAIRPAIAQTSVINLSRIAGQYFSVHPELCA